MVAVCVSANHGYAEIVYFSMLQCNISVGFILLSGYGPVTLSHHLVGFRRKIWFGLKHLRWSPETRLESSRRLVKKNPQTQLDISQISQKNMLKRSLETVVISLPVLSTYPPSTLFILPTACLSILVCIVMCLLSLILQSKWYASLFCLRLLTSTCHALIGILCCDLGGNSCMNSAT